MIGICYGGGSAPQIWSNIRSIVFSALRAEGFGIHFINYFTTEIVQLVGFSYVDEYEMFQ